MDDLRRLEARQLARAKLRSRRRRASIIRRRTVRASLGLFTVLWAIIFGRLAAGNDPALSTPRGGVASATHEPKSLRPAPQGGQAETEVEVTEPAVAVVEPEPQPVITASS